MAEMTQPQQVQEGLNLGEGAEESARRVAKRTVVFPLEASVVFHLRQHSFCTLFRCGRPR